MNAQKEQRIFTALNNGLKEFSKALESKPGEQVKLSLKRDSPIALTIKTAVTGIGDLLHWIYYELKKVQDILEKIDCGLAAYEVFGETLINLGKVIAGLESHPVFEKYFSGLSISTGIFNAEKGIKSVTKITNLIPSPEEINVTFESIKKILGPEVAKPFKGALGKLLTEVK